MSRETPAPGNDGPAIAVIGGGLGGLCSAIKLTEAGYRNVTVYEKAPRLGGTWRENTYPGIACDVPSHLYSYSFEINPDWSHAYSPGWEIQQYAERCAEKYGVSGRFELGCEIRRSEFVDGRWRLHAHDGRRFEADILISAMGGLHLPKLPDIPGRDEFSGVAFHSSQWNHEESLQGRRVAVIGSAASAVQIVPSIAADVSQLYLFQRTPNWIIPRRDRAYSRLTRWCFRHVPGLARLYRWALYWLAESRWVFFRRNSLVNRLGRLLGEFHLWRQVRDKALRAKLRPDYVIGCKRILRSDDFYPALARDNVELVTEGIDRITSSGIVTGEGRELAVDVIIYATGFDVYDIVGGTEIVGPGGESLADRWRERISAHRTIAVPGFPNFFMLQGPNSGLGHNSVIFMLEAQLRYITGCLDEMQERGWNTLVARDEAYERYQASITKNLEKMIWTGNCRSWYQDASGHVFTLWPHTCTTYWHRMRRPDMSEYQEYS